jgi:glucose dehydrogenase
MIAWDASKGKIVWSIPEQYSVWSGVLATAGGVVFYGNLEGWAKAVDAKSGKLLWKFKTPSGIIGNFNSWAHNGKQYVGGALRVNFETWLTDMVNGHGAAAGPGWGPVPDPGVCASRRPA